MFTKFPSSSIGQSNTSATAFQKMLRASILQNILSIGLIYLFFLISTVTITHKVRSHIADNFLSLARDSALLGDFRTVVQEASTLTSNASSFSRIRYLNHNHVQVFDTENSTQGQRSVFDVSFQRNLFFDEAQSNFAGAFVFYYSIRDLVAFALAALIALFGVVLLLNYLSRKRLIEQHEKEVIALRNEMIAGMTQMISHDLRAPLGVFERLLYIETDKIPEMRGLIQEALNRLHSMIESLRHSENELKIHRQECFLNFDFGAESLDQKAAKKDVKILRSGSNWGKVWVDLTKFERAWINLLSNGIDAAKHEVKIEVFRKDENLVLHVKDDGPGIPKECEGRLFERGFTFGKKEGTGLGLAYVKQVMMGHGGDVVYRREGGWTIFECVVPGAFELASALPVQETSDIDHEKPPQSLRKRIGIDLEPAVLSEQVFDCMMAFDQTGYAFKIGFDPSNDIVITNVQKTVLGCLEYGIDIIEFSSDRGIDEILRKSRRRLGI